MIIDGSAFFHAVTAGNLTVSKVSLHDINNAIEAENVNECLLEEIVAEQ